MQSPERPILITVGMYASGAFGALCLLALPLAAIGIGQYSIDEEQVSPNDFLIHAGPIFAIIGGILVVISFAIASRKEWSRSLMMIFWLATTASAATRTFVQINAVSREAAVIAALFASCPSLIAVAVAWWYLYRKPNVVAYYASLEPRESGAV